jgi:serine/threonine protein kinase
MTDESIADDLELAERVLPVGTVLCGGQFTITGQLGAGGFGITYRAADNVLGRTIVIKECFPEDFCIRKGKNVVARARAHEKPVESIVRMFIREARSLAKLRHPNIVGVHRAFEENETAYMALDLIDGRDLFDILQTNAKALSPARVKHILMQMLDAVEEVHGLDLLHRDISPDNIIIEKTGTPVLIDFGAAKGDSSRHTRAVSSLLVVKDGYSPQEFYVAGSEQSPCSDLYALAATFYHVLSGQAPANSQSRMIEMVGNKPDPCLPLVGRIPGYDDAFLSAIDLAMQVHPTDRIQSAAAWKALIAGSYAETEAVTNTQGQIIKNELSLELEMSLSRLVAETNDEVEKSRNLIPVEPETIEVPQEINSRPEWVDEFNEESLAPKTRGRRSRRGSRARAAASSVASDVHPSAAGAPNQRSQSDTNWIERAAEKQERIRSEREKELQLFVEHPHERPSKSPVVLASGLGDEGLIVTAPPRASSTPIRLLIGLLLCLCFVAYFQMPQPPELPVVNALQ